MYAPPRSAARQAGSSDGSHSGARNARLAAHWNDLGTTLASHAMDAVLGARFCDPCTQIEPSAGLDDAANLP